MHDADRRILVHATHVRQSTLELVRRIPEKWLHRIAEGEEFTLRQHLLHIASGQCYWMRKVVQNGKGFIGAKGASTREDIVRILAKADKRMLSFFSAEKQDRMGRAYTRAGRDEHHVGRDMVLYLTAHEEHHRGRIVLALRQWGFEDFPPMPRPQPPNG